LKHKRRKRKENKNGRRRKIMAEKKKNRTRRRKENGVRGERQGEVQMEGGNKGTSEKFAIC
jgi:hypothetical protein